VTACYLDASALVKLATLEPESDALRTYFARRPQRLTSRLAEVEVARALARRGRESQAAAGSAVNQAIEGLTIVELDAEIAAAAGRIEPASLRSLDAIHLASALAIGDELEALVTYDRRLADAARGAGLRVDVPG
jgi:predicted nucleic acid-binding protein